MKINGWNLLAFGNTDIYGKDTVNRRNSLQVWNNTWEILQKIGYFQVEPGKPGAEVSKKKTISQRKNLPIECAQGDQRLRCPNRSMVVVC